MAALAVAAGLVSFAGQAGFLILLASGADADGRTSGELTGIKYLHVAGLNFVRRSFRWRCALSGQSSVAFGCRLARRHSEGCEERFSS